MSLMGPNGVQLSHVRSPGAISPPDLTSRSAIHAVISYPMASRSRTANRRLLARLISGPATGLTSVNLNRGLAIDPGSSSGLTSSPADLLIWAAKLRARFPESGFGDANQLCEAGQQSQQGPPISFAVQS